MTTPDKRAFGEALEALRASRPRPPFVDDRSLDAVARAGPTHASFGQLCDAFDDPREVLTALALVRSLPRPLEAPTVVDGTLDVGIGESRFVAGDLVVRGHVVSAGRLTVCGDLRVEGDYFEDPCCNAHKRLAVGGDLALRNLTSSDDVCVMGDLEARELVYLDFSHDRALLVGGELRARVVVARDHRVEAAAFRVSHYFEDRPGPDETARLFARGLGAPHGLDFERLAARLERRGRSVLGRVADEAPPPRLTPRALRVLLRARGATSVEVEEADGPVVVRLTSAGGATQRSFLDADEGLALKEALRSTR